MKKFNIEIIDIIKKNYTVEAKTQAEAEKMYFEDSTEIKHISDKVLDTQIVFKEELW